MTIKDLCDKYDVTLKDINIVYNWTTVKDIIKDRFYGSNKSFELADNRIKAAVIIRENREN